MKGLILFLLSAFATYCFFINEDVRTGMVDVATEVVTNNGGGDSETPSKEYTTDEVEYFEEITQSTEFGGKTNKITKWETDVNIFVVGQKSTVLMSELNRIVKELNGIIDPININIVNNRANANYIICFGSQYDYHKIDPTSKPYTNGNWGLFGVSCRGKVITGGSMYVDVVRCNSLDGQKHLLREELTQSLGLFNDSYKYKNSIFQQEWTETTEYAPIDVTIIEMLYNN